jgi:hypothetical protein
MLDCAVTVCNQSFNRKLLFLTAHLGFGGFPFNPRKISLPVTEWKSPVPLRIGNHWHKVSEVNQDGGNSGRKTYDADGPEAFFRLI